MHTINTKLGKDSELRFLTNGDPVLGFSVADDQGKDKATIWWNCSLFGRRAESLAQYLSKGQKVTVTGQVTQREYTDKDGAKKVSQDIRVNDVALQGSKQAEQQDMPRREAGLPRVQPKRATPPGAAINDDFSDIPF